MKFWGKKVVFWDKALKSIHKTASTSWCLILFVPVTPDGSWAWLLSSLHNSGSRLVWALKAALRTYISSDDTMQAGTLAHGVPGTPATLRGQLLRELPDFHHWVQAPASSPGTSVNPRTEGSLWNHKVLGLRHLKKLHKHFKDRKCNLLLFPTKWFRTYHTVGLLFVKLLT